MNLIDKDALIESLGIETDCYDCEHERMKYHCDLDPVEACTKIVEAPVITVTTESAEKAIEVLKNAAWLWVVYYGNRHKGIFLGFYGNKPYALVELDDGSVAKVDIEDMVFADSKKKFQEMGCGDD